MAPTFTLTIRATVDRELTFQGIEADVFAELIAAADSGDFDSLEAAADHEEDLIRDVEIYQVGVE